MPNKKVLGTSVKAPTSKPDNPGKAKVLFWYSTQSATKVIPIPTPSPKKGRNGAMNLPPMAKINPSDPKTVTNPSVTATPSQALNS